MPNSVETSDESPEVAATFVVEQAGPRRLCLYGELDMAGVAKVRDRLVAMTGDVELDCSGLRFIDAFGLRVFVAAHRCCEERGAKLTIVDPSPGVVRLLVLSNLDSVLDWRARSSAR